MRKKNLGGKLVKSVILWAMTLMLAFSPVVSSIGTMTVYAEEVEHHDESKSEDKHENKTSDSASSAKSSESRESHAESAANDANAKAGEAKSEAATAETKSGEAKSAKEAAEADKAAVEKSKEAAEALQKGAEDAAMGTTKAADDAKTTVDAKDEEIDTKATDAKDQIKAITKADEEGNSLVDKDVDAAKEAADTAATKAKDAKDAAVKALETVIDNAYDSKEGNHDAAVNAYETIQKANEEASIAVDTARGAVEQAEQTVAAAERALSELQQDASDVETLEAEQKKAIEEAQKILDAAKAKMDAAENAYKSSMSDLVKTAETELEAAKALSDEDADKQAKIDAATVKLASARAAVTIKAATDAATDAATKAAAAATAATDADTAKQKAQAAAEAAQADATAAKDDYAFVVDGKTYANLEKQAKDADEAYTAKNTEYNTTVENGKKAVETAQKAYDASVEATTAKAVSDWEAEVTKRQNAVNAAQTAYNTAKANYDKASGWDRFWNVGGVCSKLDDADETLGNAKAALNRYNNEAKKQELIKNALENSAENQELIKAKDAETTNNAKAKAALDEAEKVQQTENAKLAYIFSRAAETLTKETMAENLTADEKAELERINKELTASMNLYKETIKDAEKYDDSTSDLRSFNPFSKDWWEELGKAFKFWTIEEKRDFEEKYKDVAGTGHFFEDLDFETAKKNTNALYNYANALCVAANIDEMELDVFNATYNAAMANHYANAADVAAKAAAEYATAAKTAQEAVAEAARKEDAAIKAYEAAKKEYEDAQKKLADLKVSTVKVDAGQIEAAKKAVEDAREAQNKADRKYKEAVASLAVARSAEAWLKDLADPDDAVKAMVFGYKGSGDAVQTENPAEVDGYDKAVKSQGTANYTATGELGENVDVPYEVMHEFVKFMYENINKDYNKAMGKNGKGIALDREDSAESATLPVVYWDVDEEGKLTGTFHVGTDASMESGRYYVAYTFKHEGDGYHFDGIYVEYTKPANETRKGGHRNRKDDVMVASVVMIDDEETPLAATIEDDETALAFSIDDELTPLSEGPQTGDTTIPVLPVALGGVVAIGAAIAFGKKKEDK